MLGHGGGGREGGGGGGGGREGGGGVCCHDMQLTLPLGEADNVGMKQFDWSE